MPPEIHPLYRKREPRLVMEVRPIYPGEARRRGVDKGTVIVQFMIDRHGRVKRPRILRATPSGHGFEEAAAKAIRKWRYEPAEINGQPVDVYSTVEVKFENDGSRSRPQE